MREAAELEAAANAPGASPSATAAARSNAAYRNAQTALRDAETALAAQYNAVGELAVSLASNSAGTFRAITDIEQRGFIAIIQAEIESGAGALPAGATSWWQPNMEIFVSQANRPLLSGRNLFLLSRDLGLEVSLVERGGRFYFRTGTSSVQTNVRLRANSSYVAHTQPSVGSVLSAGDISAFRRVTNVNALFEVISETSTGQVLAIRYTQPEIQALALLTGDAQRLAASMLARTKATALGITL
jgi:hypothetical protein